jgi:hypothetical protein
MRRAAAELRSIAKDAPEIASELLQMAAEVDPPITASVHSRAILLSGSPYGRLHRRITGERPATPGFQSTKIGSGHTAGEGLTERRRRLGSTAASGSGSGDGRPSSSLT